MHTPDQARELWCPMVRGARRELMPESGTKSINDRTVIVSGCNTDALGGMRVPASCRCIADKCGMWRWDSRITAEEQSAINEGRVNIAELVTRQITGYCGLAGRPGAAA